MSNNPWNYCKLSSLKTKRPTLDIQPLLIVTQTSQTMCSSPVELVPNHVILWPFSLRTRRRDYLTSVGGKVTHQDRHITGSGCISVLFYPSVVFQKSSHVSVCWNKTGCFRFRLRPLNTRRLCLCFRESNNRYFLWGFSFLLGSVKLLRH